MKKEIGVFIETLLKALLQMPESYMLVTILVSNLMKPYMHWVPLISIYVYRCSQSMNEG
jgi:hypothetical protein